MHKSFLIPPSINRILGKNRNSVNLINQTTVLSSKNQDLSPHSKEYTFEPKINSSNGKHRRTLQKFIEDQQKYQQQKQRKITQLKDEIAKWQDDQMRLVPQINTSYREKTPKNDKKQSVFERLSKQRPSKNLITQPESFSPLILPRSKQISREKIVSDLLYEDAKRRHSKQKIVKLTEEKKLLAMSAPKINKNTNQLVRKKIFNEFMYLINDSSMNPILALSVIEQIFNVKLRDTSSQTVKRIIELIANQKMEVSTEKLWSFIDLVIGTGFDSAFPKEVEQQIKEKYHFFYQQRINKQKKKKMQQEQHFIFQPKTLETSQQLAQRHRSKQVKKVAEFIKQQKINVHIENDNIALEDLFIISQMQIDKQIQLKRKEKQIQQLAECTFKPQISPIKLSAKPKQKIVLRQPLKEKVLRQNHQKVDNAKNNKKSCSIINSVEKTERCLVNTEQKENILKRNRKSMDQLSVRLFMARTQREFQHNMTRRGYPDGENWNESKRMKHRQIVQNCQKIKGLKNL